MGRAGDAEIESQEEKARENDQESNLWSASQERGEEPQ